ncbi:AAEL007968-PA [Aedes aegypti]|uniref:AAEL007968-PA n=1 Tax=Aedes aegypti TaxID=7159 RepID=Q170A3_AEDAE|nr:AAEL007968-PA [Aedes aegypti]
MKRRDLNVTKTRKVEYCCEGYEQITSEEDLQSPISPSPDGGVVKLLCRPICRGGCGRGHCESPNRCSCEAGFTGKHCTQRCRNGTWGENCKYRCHCQNYSLCDGKTGHCRCTDGWIGNHCETPCPNGYYGTLCKNQCKCNTSRCDRESGKCLADDDIVMFENITRVMEKDFSGESTERISLEQWVKVDGSSSTTPQVTTEIESINSSYAQSYQEYIPSNINITLIPIENITTTTEDSKNETVYETDASTTKVEITFIAASTTDNPNSKKEPELIFIETETKTDLVEFVENNDEQSEITESEEDVNHTQAVVTISCLLLALAMLLSVVAYMKKTNRRAMIKHQEILQQRQISISSDRGPDSPRVLEPLPDIPKVTYTKVMGKDQRNGNTQLEHYDVPVNNSSVNKSSPYNYNFTLNKPPPGHQPARKYSLEHIYDEIQYPPMTDLNGSTAAIPVDGGDHFSKSILPDDKMIPVKVIDEIKGKQ